MLAWPRDGGTRLSEVPREIDVATIGEDVPLFEAIRTTRAIRRLRPDPVPRALIRKVCEAGTFAPSGGNRQPWSFIAVTDLARRAFVAERYRRAFASYIAPALEAAKDPSFPDATRRNIRAALHLAEHMHEVPVHLFVAGFQRRSGPQPQALFPAVQNILLACRAVGLGASLTTVHRAFGAEIDAHLGLPEDRPSCALIPIGWPIGRYGRPPRNPVDACLFWERFEA
jgi:nitroreductase